MAPDAGPSVDVREPPVELMRALAVLAEPVTPAHASVARALDLPPPPEGSGWADLFLFQLHPYASVHLGPEGMLGGEARGRVAGFWRAVGRTPPTEPDHLAALLGLYAALLEEAAELDEAGDPAAARLVAESVRALLHEHLLPWLPAFLHRVEELGGPHHRAWAELLRSSLLAEWTRTGPGAADRPLPRHLREASELDDPRTVEGVDFLSQLLAPVRSGVVLTRHDLALVARGCGSGLRAGERRYALENLLGLEPVAVLEGLAEVARTQALAHGRWDDALGSVRAFWVARAEHTADLLTELAEDAALEIDSARAAGAPPRP